MRKVKRDVWTHFVLIWICQQRAIQCLAQDYYIVQFQKKKIFLKKITKAQFCCENWILCCGNKRRNFLWCLSFWHRVRMVTCFFKWALDFAECCYNGSALSSTGAVSYVHSSDSDGRPLRLCDSHRLLCLETREINLLLFILPSFFCDAVISLSTASDGCDSNPLPVWQNGSLNLNRLSISSFILLNLLSSLESSFWLIPSFSSSCSPSCSLV